jgi:hypothetical protein
VALERALPGKDGDGGQERGGGADVPERSVDVICGTAPCGSAQSIFTCGMGGASAECGAASGAQRTRSRKAQEVKVRGGGCHLREDKLPVDDRLVYDRHPAASYLRSGLGKSAGRGVGSAAAAAAAAEMAG